MLAKRRQRGVTAIIAAVLALFHADPAMAQTNPQAEAQAVAESNRTMSLMSVGNSAAVTEHGLSNRFGILVTFGEDVPDGELPYVVRITFRANKAATADSLCTGIRLLSFNVVLTAAHCSCGLLDTYRFIQKGVFDIDSNETPKNVWQAVRLPARYPGYDCAMPPEAQPGRDLAVFFLYGTAGNDFIPPNGATDPNKLFRLASMHEVRASEAAYLMVAGYGYTEEQAPSRVLQRGLIRIGSHFCSRGEFGRTACAGFREFVLGRSGVSSVDLPVDTCRGDSGGPVFWFPPERTGTDGVAFEPGPALVGITSRALAFADHLPGMLCGGGGVYTAVGHSAVVDWLWSLGVPVRTVEHDRKRG